MKALYNGDNLEILRRYVQDESVDLVYLDPVGHEYSIMPVDVATGLDWADPSCSRIACFADRRTAVRHASSAYF